MKKIFIQIMIFLLLPIATLGYETNVHQQITKRAIALSNIEQYLSNQINITLSDKFSDGSNNRPGSEWIELGSKWEDDNLTMRWFNHFHDPINGKGLNVDGVPLFGADSSLQWGKSDVNNAYDWSRTRYFYHLALTGTSQTERNVTFARVFRSLGQLIHLVHDLASPAHVRNDPHGAPIVQYDLYENYTKEREKTLSYSGYPAVDIAAFNSIDKFWVNDRTGLAEFVNKNFFSRDTIFKNYAQPARENTTAALVEQTAGDGQVDRVWYIQGYTSERLAAYSYFWNNSGLISTTEWLYNLDNYVHQDYASQLVPRAVGYSAGLLNYFFRGNIEIALPARGIYSSATATAAGFTSIKVLAKNTTPNNEEMSDPVNGSIKLVVRYKLAHEDPFKSLDVATDEEFTYLTASEVNNVRTIPKDSTVELTFDLGQTPLPFWATDVYLQIVYRGKLGNEDGAVAVGFKDISEPTPIDLYNNMDRLCLNGGWYLTESQEAIDQAPDGWDIYPHKIEGSNLKISFAEDTAYASPSNYTFSPETIMPGTLYRAYVLSDYDYLFTYSDYTPAVPIRSQDTASHSNAILIGSIAASAIKNQVDYQVTNETECAEVGATAPCDIRYYPLFYTFRGTNIWGPAGVIVDNPKYPVNTSCSWGALN